MNQSSEKDAVPSAADTLKRTKEMLPQREWNSIDELNQELKKVMDRQNRRPLAPFLGLSPEQMQTILYRQPFSLTNEFFDFKGDKKDLLTVPFLKQTLYFLKKLHDNGHIKATQKGNLSKAFVRELHEQFFLNDYYSYRPNKESDSPGATTLKHILILSGLMKKRHGKFTLTKKGEKLLLEENISELFSEMTSIFFNKWNWGYGDYYSNLPLLQSSAIFNLYILHKKAQDWISDEELGKIYLKAFPSLVNEVHPEFWSPEEEITKIFSLRFIERTCLPWNLLCSKREGDRFKQESFFKVSPFFRKNFHFHI